jgi:hypothetical protein
MKEERERSSALFLKPLRASNKAKHKEFFTEGNEGNKEKTTRVCLSLLPLLPSVKKLAFCLFLAAQQRPRRQRRCRFVPFDTLCHC